MPLLKMQAFSPDLWRICMVLRMYNPFFRDTSIMSLPSEGRFTFVSSQLNAHYKGDAREGLCAT